MAKLAKREIVLLTHVRDGAEGWQLPKGVGLSTLDDCYWNGYLRVDDGKRVLTDKGRAALEEAKGDG